jgi:cytidylate kinase
LPIGPYVHAPYEIAAAHNGPARRCLPSRLGSVGSSRSFVIGIDGWSRSGKSTMGRFLAWQMGMPCIETDLFLETWGEYNWDRLSIIVRRRIDADQPVIVEGVTLLHILKTIHIKADFLIYMLNEQRDVQEDRTVRNRIKAYESVFRPAEGANHVFRWNLPPDMTTALPA